MISYEIDDIGRLVVCKIGTGLRLLDVANLVEQLFGDVRFRKEFNAMVIVSDETTIPDITARNALVQLMVAWRALHIPAKWAFVLPGSAWHRLAVHVIEEHAVDSRNVRCFQTEGLAMAWLKRENDAAPRGAD